MMSLGSAVGCALDAAEAAVDGIGDHPGGGRLGEAGDTLQMSRWPPESSASSIDSRR